MGIKLKSHIKCIKEAWGKEINKEITKVDFCGCCLEEWLANIPSDSISYGFCVAKISFIIITRYLNFLCYSCVKLFLHCFSNIFSKEKKICRLPKYSEKKIPLFI